MFPEFHRSRKQSSLEKLLLLLLTCTVTFGSAQNRYAVEYIGRAEGLPSLNIIAVNQDFQGLIWFAAFATGMIRYDGNSFFVVSNLPESNPRISTNKIYALTRDSKGNLWIGGETGLDILNPKTLAVRRRVPLPDCPDSVETPVSALFTDQNQDIWMSIPSRGVVIFPNGNLAQGKFVSELHSVKYINRSANGTLWILTESTLYRWVNGAPEKRYENPATSKFNPIIREIENEDGRFAGFRLINIDETTQPYRLNLHSDSVEPGEPEDGIITTTSPDISSRILATASPRSRSPLFNHSFRTFRDTAGLIWVAPQYGGVFKLKKAEMQFTKCPDLDGVSLRGMIEKPDGSIYIASYNGLFHYFPRTNKALWMFKTRLDIFFHLLEVRGDTLFAASESFGTGNFIMRGKGTFSLWPPGVSDGLGYYASLSLGKGWFLLGNHRLVRARASDWKIEQVATLPAAPAANTFCFTKDRDGRIWIGTTDGIFLLNADYSMAPCSLRNDFRLGPDSRINDVYQDKFGRMWFATHTYGLLCYDSLQHQLYAFNKNSGFASNEVYKILDSHNGNVLWVSTFSGLQCIQLNNNRVSLFTAYDGTSGDEFNTGSFLRASSGEFYLGGVRGLTHFNPADFHPAEHHSSPFISGINIEDIHSSNITHLNYPPQDTVIELNSGQNTLEFIYGSTNYFRRETRSYFVQMEGLDNKWAPMGTVHKIKYYHLPPGKYTFLLKVVESGFSTLDSPEDVYSVSIFIDEVFYKKSWFIALAISFFLIFIGYLLNLRIQRARREENLRKRIAADLHDDLGGNLSVISNLVHTIQRLKSKNQPFDAELEALLGMTKSAHSTISDIIWALDQRDNSNATLRQRMEDYSDRWLKAAGVKVHFSSNQGDHKPIKFSVKHQLLLVYKEILSNILKHTVTDSVDIRFNIVNQKDIDLRVINYFQERKKNVVSSGRGLTILRERIARLGGNVEIQTAEHSFEIHILVENGV